MAWRCNASGSWPLTSSHGSCGGAASKNIQRLAAELAARDRCFVISVLGLATTGCCATSFSPFMIRNLKRYLALYAVLWRNSVTREMSFKGNFILWIIVELLWFGLQLCFVTVIYSQTHSVGTWTKWQMVLLVGASNFIQQLYQAFFLTNCTNLSELVRTGRMDFLLLLPVNTRFLVSLRVVDLGAFVNALFAVCVMTFAALKL